MRKLNYAPEQIEGIRTLYKNQWSISAIGKAFSLSWMQVRLAIQRYCSDLPKVTYGHNPVKVEKSKSIRPKKMKTPRNEPGYRTYLKDSKDKVTTERLERLRSLFDAGKSVKEIAEYEKITAGYARVLLNAAYGKGEAPKDMGLRKIKLVNLNKDRRTTLTKEDTAEMQAYAAHGWSLYKIAKYFGCTPLTVRRHIDSEWRMHHNEYLRKYSKERFEREYKENPEKFKAYWREKYKYRKSCLDTLSDSELESALKEAAANG